MSGTRSWFMTGIGSLLETERFEECTAALPVRIPTPSSITARTGENLLRARIPALLRSKPRAAFAAEVRDCQQQRRRLQQGAEVERRADTPVSLREVRDHHQQRRAALL